MKADMITINFLPLENENFIIPVYRVEDNGVKTKKDFSFPVKVFSLLKDNSTEERARYFVTFDKQDGFFESKISSLENRNLTIRYLSFLLEKKLCDLGFSYKVGDSFQNVIDVIIDESELGKESICIIPSHINKQFGVIIDYHFFRNTTMPYSIEMQKKSLSLDKNGLSNKNYYNDKYGKIEYFLNLHFQSIFNSLDKYNSIKFLNQMDTIEYRKLNTKSYVFHEGNKTNSQFSGIMNFGPFSQIGHDCIFGFVFRNSEKTLSHELYYALKGERFTTFNGMEKMFGVKLEKDNVIGEGVTDYNEIEIEKVVENIILRANGKKIIPVILVPWNKDTANEYESKMYYFMKYSFLKRNIPCQFVSVEKVKSHNTFKWLVSGIALQIFSKLGGQPWCLVPSTEECLIIGIGQAHRKNENKEIERYYSYSIQNNSSGLFMNIKILSDDTDYDKYLDGLSIRLKEIITSQIDKFNSFVIHTSFRLRNDEMNTIRKTIELLASDRQNKKFAVLRFNDHHYYMGYDLNNNTSTPYESSFVRIMSEKYLVWFEGLQYGYSSVKERIGPPIQVDIDFPSKCSYSDTLGYLQDAINLSGANWRGFNAKTMPVSILYAHLLSGFIEAFDRHGFKDIDIEHLTPWFI